MSRKVQSKDNDVLIHRNKPIEAPVKLLEVTPENLNAVLLELKNNEVLLNLNFKNIMNFIFKTFRDNSQILAKLKILSPRENEEEDVVDSIFRIIVKILGYNLEEGLKRVVIIVSGEIYPFSRRLSLWYFQNKQLEEEEVEFYLEEIERIVFKTGYVNFITGEEVMEEVSEEDVDVNDDEVSGEEESDEKANEEITHSADEEITHSADEEITNSILGDLKVLTDSEEIDRLDKALGIVFKSKQVPLSVADKKRIAKCLDVMETILEKHSIDNRIHFKRVLGLVDIDDVLFKKVFRILKLLTKKFPDEHLEELYSFYVDALYKYKNIARTIDTMQDYFKGLFKWMDVFKASFRNELLDLNIVDRSKINKEEFYTYCFNEQVHLWKIQGILLYFTRKEENTQVLEGFKELVNRIEFSDEKLSVIESINNRINSIKGA